MLTADKSRYLARFVILRFIGSQEAIEDYEIDKQKVLGIRIRIGLGEGSALPILF